MSPHSLFGKSGLHRVSDEELRLQSQDQLPSSHLGVDLSAGPGMTVANIMASVAQGQSDLYSERNKAIAARLRKMNRPTNGTKKLGCKLAGKGKDR